VVRIAFSHEERVALPFSQAGQWFFSHASRFTRPFGGHDQEEPYVEHMQETSWVLLVYKVPREPTSSRAMIWRKLKRLGALLLHDAVWVLPATAWTREQFQWLAVEIGELGGEAYLWESRLPMPGQAEGLVRQFQTRVESAYQEILDALERDNVDLVALSRTYQQVRAQDYFHSALGTQARERLMRARGGFVS
jgi:hypothetical protein